MGFTPASSIGPPGPIGPIGPVGRQGAAYDLSEIEPYIAPIVSAAIGNELDILAIYHLST